MEVGVLGHSKVNTLAAAAFIETLRPIKHATFVAECRVCALIKSDSIQFAPIINEVEGCLL